jgi:predicted tellurium resistance membrane protein TerC
MSATLLDFRPLLTTEGLITLITLTGLEIILGIDNIVFIAIVSERIDQDRRSLLRRMGLGLALVMRLGLLFTLTWMMGLTRPLVTVMGHGLSGRDLVLLGGGLFLIVKSTYELFQLPESDRSEGDGGGANHAESPSARGRGNFSMMLAQILILDIVFSLDSVITAVGMARQLSIMVTAMVIAVGVMLVGANAVGDFIHRHPSMKILALTFLLMVGALLVLDAFGIHINKGYVYTAMGYALGVELLNINYRRRLAKKG